MARSGIKRLAVLLGLGLAGVVPALAHPHVWVTSRAEIVYGSDGKVTGVRHRWTFDEAYSAYVTQGLDANKDGKLTPDELQELAKVNTESLSDYNFFTEMKANGARQEFDAPRDPGMSVEGGRLTLSYVLPLKRPASSRVLGVEIYDPTFFVSFSLAEGDDAVRLDGAPKGCAATVTRPKPMDPEKAQTLSESFFNALTASSSFGKEFSNRVLVACP